MIMRVTMGNHNFLGGVSLGRDDDGLYRAQSHADVDSVDVATIRASDDEREVRQAAAMQLRSLMCNPLAAHVAYFSCGTRHRMASRVKADRDNRVSTEHGLPWQLTDRDEKINTVTAAHIISSSMPWGVVFVEPEC